MMERTAAVLLLFAALVSVVAFRDPLYLDLLVDLLREDKLRGVSRKVNFFSCWNKELNTRLWKRFSLLGVLTRVMLHSQSWQDINMDDYNEAMITIVDLTCPNTHELLVQAGKAQLLLYPHRWISLEHKHGNVTVDFRKLPVLVDSHVLVCRETEGGDFVVGEVFKRGRQEPLVSQDVGAWSSERGLQLYQPQTVSQPVAVRRHDLMGTTIKAAIVVTDNDTYRHMTSLQNKHIDTVTKLNYALLIHVIEMLNGSLEVVYTDSWGYFENDSWNGLSGLLQRGEVDIGGTAMFITKDRMDFMEYIAETSPANVRFIFRQPPLSYVSNIFTLPFSSTVWVASAALITFIGVLLFGALKWETKHDVTFLDLERTKDTTWSDIVLLSLGSICQQGAQVEVHSVPGRLITLILFVVVIFLYTSYSASIVALLRSPSDSINTLYDLLHSRVELGVHDIVYNHHYFKMSTDPVRNAIYHQKIAPPGEFPHFYNITDGVERIRKGFFAFHVHTSMGYQIVLETFHEEEKCGFKEITFLPSSYTYIAQPKFSQYREMFKRVYHRILESGLQNRAVRRFYVLKLECTFSGSNFVSVGIVDFYPALLVLAYGWLCAITMLAAEIMVHKRLWSSICKKHPVDTDINTHSGGNNKWSSSQVFLP